MMVLFSADTRARLELGALTMRLVIQSALDRRCRGALLVTRLADEGGVGDAAGASAFEQTGIRAHQQRQIRSKFEQALEATRKAVVVVLIRGEFLSRQQVAVMLAAGDGGAHRQDIADFAVDHTVEFLAVVVAKLDSGTAFEMVDRLVGDQIDCASGGIAAVKGSLRAAQHFDPLKIEEPQARRLRPTQVDTVDVKRSRRVTLFSRIGAGRAANRDHGRATIVGYLHIRDQVGQARRIDGSRRLEFLARQYGQGDRNLGSRLGNPLRRHEHLLKLRSSAAIVCAIATPH